MRIFLTVACLLATGPFIEARKPVFQPTEGQISEHRAEVYRIARDYIVESLNLEPLEESRFNPVRFNSYGVWGDFQTRVKELGDDRFEVQGWIVSAGLEEEEVKWSVVLRYELADPEAWRYRRIDDQEEIEPDITSWKFGRYRSVPYEAHYSGELASRFNR